MATALSIREQTAPMASRALDLLQECDVAQTRLQIVEDDHLQAMALLHGSIVDCQLVLSALWTQAGMLDRLQPQADMENHLFPQGITHYTRKAGTGFSIVIDDLTALIEVARGSSLVRDMDALLSQLEEDKAHVEMRLELEQKSKLQTQQIAEEIDVLKQNIDDLFLEVEYELKRLYRRNKKLIASFFR
ncbi:hypothetical protein KKF84_14655 [Myxococcota bacterium]|nr:hypothetical protein [Myxococcota bacterium]